ncbi:MAG: hypothetical protein FWH17_02570 [Oscillospiraceae bacterium]|nr:hypothetical protein [Oscillospiraceae bacterium]
MNDEKCQENLNIKKNASIEFILEQGLQKPQTARSQISKMLKTLGFRYIFWDTFYSLFFTAITVACVLLVFAVVPESLRFSACVAVAPLLFLCITAFTETAQRVCGLYELKQTCLFTLRQITALRVVCYSVIGAVFTAVIAASGAKSVYEFAAMFPLCLFSLFACAALSLTVMRFKKSKWNLMAYSVLWVFISVALPFSQNELWESFLARIPIAVSSAAALIGFALFAFQISKMLVRQPAQEVNKYAHAQ